MMNRKGTIWIILGLLLIAAALLITAQSAGKQLCRRSFRGSC